MKRLSLGDLVMILGLVIVCAGVSMMYLPAAVIILGTGIAFLGQRIG